MVHNAVVCKVLLLFFVLCVSGCATLIHGTRQRVAVTSEPAGAQVSDGEVSIETPGVLDLQRDRDYIVTITKPGFEAEGVKIEHVISGAVVANLLLPGGIIGCGIDTSNGALYRLEPETLHVSLRPLEDTEMMKDEKRPSVATLAGKLEELNGLKDKELITLAEYQAIRQVVVGSVVS